ncbi:MAG TPA: Ig-like domain-containing protein, partial [Thermoplasmata archaeon]|nr:Ig-like domain-containing protein [Thermoplasmata archaeon]
MSLNVGKSALVLVSAAFVLVSVLPLAALSQPDEDQKLQFERYLAEQRGFRAYKYYTYGAMVKAMKDLETKYPDFVLVENSQDKYGISSPGTCQDDTGASTACKQWHMRITNEKTLSEWTPEVWLSGALHGDERVGPNAVMELAIYLLDHYDTNSWMKRLVDSRSVWITPMTNALGYNNIVRTENNIDPNRDFAYDQDPTACMQTWTARGVNELWRDHMFQRSVTFHAGTVVIGYEWGSTNHNTNPWESPDDQSQAAFGKYMSKYAGPFGGTYPYGRQNDPSIIYPVKGGMEDWGYAASWENNYTNPKPVPECNPSANGGWDPAKTRYNGASHRSANILVETSTSKQPAESSFGTDENVLNVSGTGDGHLPRNMRLALVIIDGVQPYVQMLATPPAQASQGEVVDFNWQVGGSFKTDETQVLWGTDPDPVNKSTQKSTIQTGLTRWDGATYTEKVTMPSAAGDNYFVVRARVDQNWKQQGSPQPVVQPQEHVTRARIDPTYYNENAGHKVQGRLDWYSSVHKITVGGGAAAPQVVTNSPPNNQIDVPTGTPVQVTFSKDMDKPSVEGAHSMSPAATGAFAWPDAKTVKWNPSPDLQANTKYCYTVAKTAKDTTGLAMVADFNSCFTTAAGNQSVPPRVVTTVPNDGDTGVRPDAELVITFSKDIDAASVAAAAANKEFIINPAIPCAAQPCPDKWELLKPTELHYTHPGVNQKFLLG